MALFGLFDDEDKIGGMLNRTGDAIGNYFAPDKVPEGALYDKDTLGLARSTLLTNLGLNLYAASQNGMTGAQRAQAISQMGDAGNQYQQMLARSSREGQQRQELDLRRRTLDQQGAYQQAQIAHLASQGRLTDAQIGELNRKTAEDAALQADLARRGGLAAPTSGAPVTAAPGAGGTRPILQIPGYQGDDVDALTRTIYGEARGEGPEGQAAVAHVVRNRSNLLGQSVRDVALTKGQFEPWNNEQTRAALLNLDPASPEYQNLRKIAEGVLSGQTPDPTNGATHFFSPGAQRALGREAPSWADSTPTVIGRHNFYARPADFGRPQQQAPLSPEQATLTRPVQVASAAPVATDAPAGPQVAPEPAAPPQGPTPTGAPLSPQQAALVRPMPNQAAPAPARQQAPQSDLPPGVTPALEPFYRAIKPQPRPADLTQEQYQGILKFPREQRAAELARQQSELALRQRQWDADSTKPVRYGSDEAGYVIADGNGRFLGAIPGKAEAGFKPDQRASAERELMDRHERDPAVKEFAKIQENTRKVLDPKTDDYQRMILMVKLNDPNAAVQDGDRKALEQYMSSTTNNAFVRMYQELTGKREFGQQTRQMIEDAYTSHYLTAANNYEKASQYYRDVGRDQGINPANVGRDSRDIALHDRLLAPNVRPQDITDMPVERLRQFISRESFIKHAPSATIEAMRKRLAESTQPAS